MTACPAAALALLWAVSRVLGHLAALDPGPHSEAVLAEITRQAATVETAPSPRTPREDLHFGLPASHWLDLRSYDPVATAARLDKPLLILQGGRDYQVTVEHDLSLWREGLTRHPDVTIQIHPADDHLILPGTGLGASARLQATPVPGGKWVWLPPVDRATGPGGGSQSPGAFGHGLGPRRIVGWMTTRIRSR